ncbi:glycosyltransferase family 4 protein [Salegentibacter salarius]|uniref:Glycosyl transferase family 1 domain-containing protein n=1 Tax=Salegentibacter salarius TaxID=435906 RepID=A0A2N0TRZ5_9FLAO|nr:glycosyltransferase family 4 protein [Salegentibacter salarius]OEY71865.1 hypothetical protein BHS39_04170 [Salegentibacter salarius]PKD17458.1 hypothetical protein APR40_04170 [Salegentibacter salarius]SLK04691.1 Glycosyltransferase involved in cell wall bisynthesis [Salegentibacter salarius]
MKLLVICNDFSYTKVHSNLSRELDEKGVRQVIYHPLRNEGNIGVNGIEFKTLNSKIIYSGKLKKHHKFLFESKVKFLYKDLISKIDPESFTNIYATTLFSDGTLAYKLFRDYNIPYIVTIRNTDIHIFLKYRPDLKRLAIKILSNASKVIFISKSNYENFFNHRLIKGAQHFKQKVEVINNGIDDFWLENYYTKGFLHPATDILFIGKLDRNKNIINLIRGFQKLKKEQHTIRLNIVGSGGANDSKVRELAKEDPSIKLYGEINSKEKLLQIFRKNHFFAMVSHRETFGLVYIEALSQGLPLLFSKDQGIDGTFNEKIGVAVDSNSVNGIYEGLRFLTKNVNQFQQPLIGRQNFSWENVANKYFRIFRGSEKQESY